MRGEEESQGNRSEGSYRERKRATGEKGRAVKQGREGIRQGKEAQGKGEGP